jgi:hypothetical protein
VHQTIVGESGQPISEIPEAGDQVAPAGIESAAPAPITMNASGTPTITQKIGRRMR